MQRRTFIHSTGMAALAATFPGWRSLAAVQSPTGDLPASQDAVRGTGEHFSLTAGEIKDFAGALRGRVLLPNSDGYERARFIQNRSFDKRPAMIVQPIGVVDVQHAVNFARGRRMLVAVKCGGHSFSGDSTCDGGMMIDLAALSGVRVDPAARSAWVFGGSLLGMVDRETAPYDLAVPLGTVSDTGIGGLVAGGGLGRIGKRFGMSIDSLVSVDVVTADGKVVHANAKDNPDLFWGVRGGGGNFGIIVNFEFGLHPMKQQAAVGRITFGADKAVEALRLFAEYSMTCPAHLDLMLTFTPSPRATTFTVCHTGDPNNLEKDLAPIRRVGTPTADQITPMAYVDVQRSGDRRSDVLADPRTIPVRLQKNRLIAGVGPDLVKAIVDSTAKRNLAVSFWQGVGQPGAVKSTDTAFTHRHATHTMVCGTNWRQGEEGSAQRDNLLGFWREVEPFLKGKGFYFNYAGMDAILDNSNYGENLPRLVQIKNKYDPGNLFRLNANIPPSVKT
jgi:FAD binding domain/Berberine and berberine like